MQLISKFNIGFSVSLFVIDIFSKYVWVIPLNIKKLLQLLINLIANQKRCGLMKEVNFIIDQWNDS